MPIRKAAFAAYLIIRLPAKTFQQEASEPLACFTPYNRHSLTQIPLIAHLALGIYIHKNKTEKFDLLQEVNNPDVC
jgi:hypothetical protein